MEEERERWRIFKGEEAETPLWGFSNLILMVCNFSTFSQTATDGTSSTKKRSLSLDEEKSKEKAGDGTTPGGERGGKRPRVEGLELEVEAQLELKIPDGTAGSRLKLEKVSVTEMAMRQASKHSLYDDILCQ